MPRGRTQTFGGSANYSSKQKLSLKDQGISEQYQRNSSETKGKALFVCSSGTKVNEGHFRVVQRAVLVSVEYIVNMNHFYVR